MLLPNVIVRQTINTLEASKTFFIICRRIPNIFVIAPVPLRCTTKKLPDRFAILVVTERKKPALICKTPKPKDVAIPNIVPIT